MNVPKLRFKEFNDEWSFTELAKISSDISYGMGFVKRKYKIFFVFLGGEFRGNKASPEKGKPRGSIIVEQV